MSKASSNKTTKISSYMLMIIFITLILSLAALIIAVGVYTNPSLIQNSDIVTGLLLLMGFFGVALSSYLLFQTRRRIMRLRMETPPITTTIECKKCGVKSTREFQRGDFIFKELEPCQKCNDKMIITAIYREIKEKGREPFSP
jgi:hypothetical protein